MLMRKRYELPTISPESSRESVSSMSGAGSEGQNVSDSHRWLAAMLLLLLSVAWIIRSGEDLDKVGPSAMTHSNGPSVEVVSATHRHPHLHPDPRSQDKKDYADGSPSLSSGQLGQMRVWERALRNIAVVEQQVFALASRGDGQSAPELVHTLSELSREALVAEFHHEGSVFVEIDMTITRADEEKDEGEGSGSIEMEERGRIHEGEWDREMKRQDHDTATAGRVNHKNTNTHMNAVDDLVTYTLTLETAPIALLPYSVLSFLRLVLVFDGGQVYANAPHVLQAQLSSVPWEALAWQEYSPVYPHERLTVAFAGAPATPDWYVNLRNNTELHGPHPQGVHGRLPEVVFGKLVSGVDGTEPDEVLEALRSSMPSAEENVNWVCSPEERVSITGMRLVSAPS